MTISEQLQFSVLTTPVAALDRRALSQAWYSALYGNGSGTAAKLQKRQPQKPCGVAHSPRPHGAVHVAAAQSRQPLAPRLPSSASQAQSAAAPADRRAPRSPLARKIERAFLHPKRASRKASFTIEGEGGRVHVLMRSQGPRLKLIAICPPKSRSQVAAALAQARYALALRGIDLDAHARSDATC
jgi:hypothetical protein